MDIRTRIIIRIPKKDREVEPRRMDHNSSAGIYVTASVEAECRMISQSQKIQEEENKGASKVNSF